MEYYQRKGDRMIELNYRDSRPIYEQIEDGFKKLIIGNVLKKDEKLPSVRLLATKLSINPNTIQRAYNELESKGYLYSVPGKGSFVNGITKVDEEKIKELIDEILEKIKELKYLGMTDEEIVKILTEEMG